MRNTLFSSVLATCLAMVPLWVSAAPAAGVEQAAVAAEALMPADKVNINTADALTLQKSLSGIGLNKANAIVAYRETHGRFASVDELIEVQGVGKTLLDRNRERIVLE